MPPARVSSDCAPGAGVKRQLPRRGKDAIPPPQDGVCRRLSFHRNSGGAGAARTRRNCDVEGECAALTIRTISRNRSAIAVALTGWTHPCADVYEKKTGCREPHTLPPHLREAFIRLRRTNASRRWKDSLRHTPSCVAARLRGEAAILRCGWLWGEVGLSRFRTLCT